MRNCNNPRLQSIHVFSYIEDRKHQKGGQVEFFIDKHRRLRAVGDNSRASVYLILKTMSLRHIADSKAHFHGSYTTVDQQDSLDEPVDPFDYHNVRAAVGFNSQLVC